ncbi:hypothetical protein Catovirus_1_394 [Catovirus CTV1]|uniref:Uncharacterized protein n=1 Tax=Catovirus CTV1 TaxID=1977631 RepID=A0A1V0S9I6_9VIRU|nr:hypothetical protein Catovirus_1_394 [Catovirus CTV1]
MNNIFNSNNDLFIDNDEKHKKFLDTHKKEIIDEAIKKTLFTVRYENNVCSLNLYTKLFPDDVNMEKNMASEFVLNSDAKYFDIMKSHLREEYLNQLTTTKLYIVPGEKIRMIFDANKKPSIIFNNKYAAPNNSSMYYVATPEKIGSYNFAKKYDLDKLFQCKCVINYPIDTMPGHNKTVSSNIYMIGNDKTMNCSEIRHINNWLFKEIYNEDNKIPHFLSSCLRENENLIDLNSC